MRHKNILFIVSLAVTLLITSCGGEEVVQTGSAFIGGTQGIIASFEPFSIQEEGVYSLFDSEDFPIDVILKNKGEEGLAVGKASLRLLGPPQSDFQNIPTWDLNNKQEVEKISEFNPDGGEEIVSFTPNSRALYKGTVTGFTDITWNLEYEYDYKTHLIIDNVCFKGDITDKKVCEVKEAKSFSVSGAPIQITAVEEDTGGKGIMILKIGVEDKGTGESTVVGKDFDKRFDQVSYEIDEPGKWECKSGGRENEARLLEEKAQIICRLKQALQENELYTKPVRLTFDYRYKELIQEKLRIKESAK